MKETGVSLFQPGELGRKTDFKFYITEPHGIHSPICM